MTRISGCTVSNSPCSQPVQDVSGLISEGDGQVTPDAVKEAEVVACSEYHSDILQDEAIRRAVNTAIQQATWEYKAKQGK